MIEKWRKEFFVVGGAYISGANNVLTQGYTNGFGNINVSQVLFSSVMGGLTAEAGQFISRSIAPGMSKVAGSLTESPVLQQQLIQGATNAAARFSINTGFSLLNGDNLKVALGKGGQGALFGLGLGVINGTVTGIQIANRYHENPWTGVPLKEYHYTNSANIEGIINDGIRKSSDGYTYTTSNGKYSSDQAIKALNLDDIRGARDAVIELNTKAMRNDGIIPSIFVPYDIE